MNHKDEQTVRQSLEASKLHRAIHKPMLHIIKSMYNVGYEDGVAAKRKLEQKGDMYLTYKVLDQSINGIMATVRIAMREHYGREEGHNIFEAFQDQHKFSNRATLLFNCIEQFKIVYQE